MASYNGYSTQERHRKAQAGKTARKTGEVPAPRGPCSICGDPDVPVEYHSEDYSQPYRWVPPAMHTVCRHCHRDKLHKRFTNPDLWRAFQAHVRRGGYARDLIDPVVAAELKRYRRALRRGEPFVLRTLRPYSHQPGTEWWAGLSLDPETLTSPSARPRPKAKSGEQPGTSVTDVRAHRLHLVHALSLKVLSSRRAISTS
jgi:hypothetical protein